MKRTLPLLLLLLAVGCEVLEEDISGKKLIIIAPADGATAVAEVDFRWRATASTAGYEFSVVSPSFDGAVRILSDTVIYADTLSRSYGCHVVLPPGRYEWSVKGFNGSYTTRTVTRTLTVVPVETFADPECPEGPVDPELSTP